MLIRFAAANHRSIKAPIELSLVAVDGDRPAVRRFERIPEGLLTLAAIYGPNASGKSNVVDALSWLSLAVRNSLRAWEETIPREPFRFDDQGSQPTVYEVDFLVEGVRHVYSLHLDDESVLFEELLSYPERRPRQLFVREGQELHFRRGLGGASAIQELFTPTTLVLSLARRLEIREFYSPARYISDMSIPFIRRRQGRWPPYSSTNTTRQLFLDDYRS